MKFNASLYITFAILLVSCSTQPIRPLPREERLPVTAVALRDLTGAYKTITPSLERSLEISLAHDFFVIARSKFDTDKLVIAQNFLRPSFDVADTNRGVLLSGDVERIDYKPVKTIKEMITTYALFGLVGLALYPNDDDMALYVQYRIYANDIERNTTDTLLVAGVATGNPKSVSRASLTIQANKMAACDLVNQLCQVLYKKRAMELSKESVSLYGDFDYCR